MNLTTKWIYDAFKRKSLEQKKRIGKRFQHWTWVFFPQFSWLRQFLLQFNSNQFPLRHEIQFVDEWRNVWKKEFNFPQWNSLLLLVLCKKILFYLNSSFLTLSKVMKIEIFPHNFYLSEKKHSNVFQLSDNFFVLRFKFNSFVSTTFFFFHPLEMSEKFFIIFCHFSLIFKMLNFFFLIFYVILLDSTQLNHFEWKHKAFFSCW